MTASVIEIVSAPAPFYSKSHTQCRKYAVIHSVAQNTAKVLNGVPGAYQMHAIVLRCDVSLDAISELMFLQHSIYMTG